MSGERGAGGLPQGLGAFTLNNGCMGDVAACVGFCVWAFAAMFDHALFCSVFFFYPSVNSHFSYILD